MKKILDLYPLFLALYFPLILYIKNLDMLSISNVVGAVITVFIFAFIVLWITHFNLKDKVCTNVISSLFFFFFFTYGKTLYGFTIISLTRFHRLLSPKFQELLYSPSRYQIYWLIFEICLFLVTSLLIKKSNKSYISVVDGVLRFIVVTLVLSLIFECGFSLVEIKSIKDKLGNQNNNQQITALSAGKSSNPELPNIYYIILDEYAGSDILLEKYYFDNSRFINYLESEGFYVARKSRSNYSWTMMSVASTLNMEYIHPRLIDIGDQNDMDSSIKVLVEDNLLFKVLKQYGYSIVNVNTGYAFNSFQNEDAIYSPGSNSFSYNLELLQSTPLKLILKSIPYNLHRTRVNYVLNQLSSLKLSSNQPTFVFTHLFSPHPPFVFGPNGEAVNPDTEFYTDDRFVYFIPNIGGEVYIGGYRNQITYITNRIQSVIEELLKEATRPTIIILQGDHGPRSDENDHSEHFSILNAYYFPEEDYSLLYPDISPVNSFRLVLNKYFGTSYNLLKDTSWYCTGHNYCENIDLHPSP